jgi:hypothetical protein
LKAPDEYRFERALLPPWNTLIESYSLRRHIANNAPPLWKGKYSRNGLGGIFRRTTVIKAVRLEFKHLIGQAYTPEQTARNAAGEASALSRSLAGTARTTEPLTQKSTERGEGIEK